MGSSSVFEEVQKGISVRITHRTVNNAQGGGGHVKHAKGATA